RRGTAPGLRWVAAGAILLLMGLALAFGRHALIDDVSRHAFDDLSTWAIVDLGGGDVLRVAPGSAPRVIFPAFEHRKISLRSGEIEAKVQTRDPGQDFTVETPHLRVRVVGTRFRVKVQEDQTLVTVLEGHVLVEGPGGTVSLHAGDQVFSTDSRFRRQSDL